MTEGWSGNQFGDIWLGAKFNLSSQFDQKPVAFGLRGLLKLPTAKDDDEGVGTGKMDFAFDAIVSKEINERVELSGFGGIIFRGKPGRRRDLERFPLGLRPRPAEPRRACGSPRNCTARPTSTIPSTLSPAR